MNRYRLSTFARAHGVLRRNFRLDATLGFSVKHRMRTCTPSSAQPKCATSSVTICSSVTPCSGLRGCSLLIRRKRPPGPDLTGGGCESSTTETCIRRVASADATDDGLDIVAVGVVGERGEVRGARARARPRRPVVATAGGERGPMKRRDLLVRRCLEREVRGLDVLGHLEVERR